MRATAIAPNNAQHSTVYLGAFTGHNFRPPEPPVSLVRALLAGLSIATFVVGGLVALAELS